MHDAQKQIVLTSDKAPADIPGLEQKLRSRFEGGLIADVHPPTREMRGAILRSKARAQGVDLSDAVIELFVQRGGNSVRELEGALNRSAALAAVRGTAITMELAQMALSPYARVRAVSVETVQEMVSHRFGVSIADLVSHRREREVSYPRQIAMYLSRVVAEASFPTIAEKFGGRDHTTVMYAVRTIETRRAADMGIDKLLSGFEGELRNAEDQTNHRGPQRGTEILLRLCGLWLSGSIVFNSPSWHLPTREGLMVPVTAGTTARAPP